MIWIGLDCCSVALFFNFLTPKGKIIRIISILGHWNIASLIYDAGKGTAPFRTP